MQRDPRRATSRRSPGSTRPTGTRSIDPTKTSTVPVTGHVEAPRSSVPELEARVRAGRRADRRRVHDPRAAAAAPTRRARSATIDLSSGPRSHSGRQRVPRSPTDKDAGDQREVHGDDPRPGHRRAGPGRRGAADDRRPPRPDSMADGFPKKIGPGGESQPVLADIQGTGKLAIDLRRRRRRRPRDRPNGNELPGWPVHDRRGRR